jgi:hypothetical protein
VSARFRLTGTSGLSLVMKTTITAILALRVACD